MRQTYYFPIKGTFYYAADLAMQSNLITLHTAVTLLAETDNVYDKNAIQIWLPPFTQSTPATTPNPGLLLGYVPRTLAKTLHAQLAGLETIAIVHFARHGARIELDCQMTCNLPWSQAIPFYWQCHWVQFLQALKRLARRFDG